MYCHMDLTVYQNLAALHLSQGYTTCLVKNSIICVVLCGYLLMRISNWIFAGLLITLPAQSCAARGWSV